MKKLISIIFLALWTSLSIGQARIQVIHNAADNLAEEVDIWLNNDLLLDNFRFRTASPFIDAPAGVDFDVVIQASNSSDTLNPLARFTYNLANGETYVLIANGLIDQVNYTPFVPFNIHVYHMGREKSGMAGNTDILVFHGATDAPAVDIFEVEAGAGRILDDLAYAHFSGYLELPTAHYALQVRNEEGNSSLAEYDADLMTLGLMDSAITVLASGFLNPANNNNGAAFGLYAALASGGNLIALPARNISTARVQVIHNAADAAAAEVDIWLDNSLLLDDFAFRTASPFIDAPAGRDIHIAVQPKNSTDTMNPLARFTYKLTGNEKYILVANGLIDAANHNPFKAFDIHVYDKAREMAMQSDKVDILVFHGASDAPSVDVDESAIPAGNLISDLMYGEFEDYLSLDAADYILDIKDQASMKLVDRFAAPLNSLQLEGSAITVLASGFLNPMDNNNGAPFGLFVALPAGGNLVPLQKPTSVQDPNGIQILTALYPNPGNDYLNILMFLQENTQVHISIHDMLGQKIKDFELGIMQSGQHLEQINVKDVTGGNYVLSIKSDLSSYNRTFQISR
jgi:hypothetical protein